MRTNYMRRGEIAHDNVIFPLPDDLCDFASNLLDTHLRLLVVGCNFRGRNQVALCLVKLGFNTFVEEKCDMGIFLGL
jgi:hypothetical protein